MKEIRQWTAVICFASLAAALFQNLLPHGGMERMGRFVIGAFLVCAMISPVAKFTAGLSTASGSFSSSDEVSEAPVESAVNDQILTESQKSISNLVRAELARNGIQCKNVAVKMDTDASGCISIGKVTVELYGEDAARTAEAKEILEKELGLETEVTAHDG